MSALELVCRIVVVSGTVVLAIAWLLAQRESRRDKAERRVLGLLAHGEWVFGADIIRRCNLGRGVGYWLLDDMEESGLIESRPEPSPVLGLPRRLYRKRELLSSQREREKQGPG